MLSFIEKACVFAMKNKIRLFLLFAFLPLITFACAQAVNNTEENKLSINPTNTWAFYVKTVILAESDKTIDIQATPSFTLPTSLHIIDDSAFEGTALVSVDIPETVTYIGDNAFANIPSLLAVRIPDATEFIGKDAFANSNKVTITASSNSYARTWAKDNGFRFQLLATFSASNGGVSYSFQSDPGFHSSQKERMESSDTANTNIRERRTGRTVGELKASQYKGVAALYVQSRYFP